MKPVRHLSDEKRFPMLTDAGRGFLRDLREHPNAPKYNYSCGDQLTRAGLENLHRYEQELRTAKRSWRHGETPDWVLNFADRCLLDVPFYRQRGGSAEDFSAIPTCSRKDIVKEQWLFVPDSQPLDELMMYYTSGTTGKTFDVLMHPEVSAKYLVKLREALRRIGVTLEGGVGRVFAINICAQSSTLTYATIASYLNEAGYIKINLNPNEWRNPDDVAQFIDAQNPEIYMGDPISFLALTKYKLQTRPKALMSSAMKLMPALKQELEEHFGCPMIDVYSMTESRFIAASYDTKRYEIIPHDLYVEILDAEGNACPPGVRGEVTLTCGRNPFQPLLRYRTGDFAALDFSGDYPALVEFEGRQTVMFVNTEGKIINNIEVTRALEPFAIAQFSLHQNADHSLLFKMRGNLSDEAKIKSALLNLFGATQQLQIEELREDETSNGKALHYSTDLQDFGIANTEFHIP